MAKVLVVAADGIFHGADLRSSDHVLRHIDSDLCIVRVHRKQVRPLPPPSLPPPSLNARYKRHAAVWAAAIVFFESHPEQIYTATAVSPDRKRDLLHRPTFERHQVCASGTTQHGT